MQIAFSPNTQIAEELQELSRITQRPFNDLINDLLAPSLSRMIELNHSRPIEELIENQLADRDRGVVGE
jgi:hypothetical protein